MVIEPQVSRPAGLHRRPLAQPDVNLLAHPAPIKQTSQSNGLSVARIEVLLLPVASVMLPLDPTPSLQLHYEPSSLLRVGPPHCSASRFSPLGLLPNGNLGSSTVTVAVGTPRIIGSSAGVSVDPSGAVSVKIVLTNTGTGNARNLKINTLVFRVLSGTGTITYNTALSGSLPLAIGNLDVGASVTTVIYVNVPSTVTRMSVTESGPVQDVKGTSYNYSTAEAVIP